MPLWAREIGQNLESQVSCCCSRFCVHPPALAVPILLVAVAPSRQHLPSTHVILIRHRRHRLLSCPPLPFLDHHHTTSPPPGITRTTTCRHSLRRRSQTHLGPTCRTRARLAVSHPVLLSSPRNRSYRQSHRSLSHLTALMHLVPIPSLCPSSGDMSIVV